VEGEESCSRNCHPAGFVEKSVPVNFISRALKNPDAFVKMIEPIYIYFLKDRAADVRELGLSKISDLISVYNMQWAINSFYPKIIDTLNKENGFVRQFEPLFRG
jgi:serine/threonine-protein phosphatase 2A regulatory subunit A